MDYNNLRCNLFLGFLHRLQVLLSEFQFQAFLASTLLNYRQLFRQQKTLVALAQAVRDQHLYFSASFHSRLKLGYEFMFLERGDAELQLFLN